MRRIVFLFLFLFLAPWLACSGGARADEAALTRRATQLREAPGDTARTVAALPAQAPVLRGEARSGPWVQVRTPTGPSGWLHLFDLGPAPAPVADGVAALSGALRGVSTLLGGARPVQTTGTTSGIRGLGAEDLAHARPDPAAVARMESLRQSEAEARAFAQAVAWRPASVAPLPLPLTTREPPAPAAAPAADPGQPQMP